MAVLTPLPPDLLTVTDAAKRLGISKNTAYRMAEKGELPGAFKVGRHWRVSVIRLEKHMHGEAS